MTPCVPILLAPLPNITPVPRLPKVIPLPRIASLLRISLSNCSKENADKFVATSVAACFAVLSKSRPNVDFLPLRGAKFLSTARLPLVLAFSLAACTIGVSCGATDSIAFSTPLKPTSTPVFNAVAKAFLTGPFFPMVRMIM